MSEDIPQNYSPMRKLEGLNSDDAYGSTNHKKSNYTPSKLESNYMYKEVTVTKILEKDKGRIIELETLNNMLEDNIRRLKEENELSQANYEDQIEMYKRMLQEKQEETRRLIKNQELISTKQIQTILEKHSETSKIVQAEKQQLQSQIQYLLAKISELQKQLNHGTNAINQLNSKFSITSQKLIDTEDKLQKTEDQKLQHVQKLNKQLNALNNKLIQQNTNYKDQLGALTNNHARQIDALNRNHLVELDKVQARRQQQLKGNRLDILDITNTFDREGKRLDGIINNKDKVNEALGLELRKEKERIFSLTRNYDQEIGKLVIEKDNILSDFASVNNEKKYMSKQLADIATLYDTERGRNAIVVNALQTQLQRKNLELVAQNQRLILNANAINRSLDLERSEQNRRLVLQINSLKSLLSQTSSQMNKFKQQYIQLQLENDQLMRINKSCEVEAIRLKSLVSDQDMHLRLRRI